MNKKSQKNQIGITARDLATIHRAASLAGLTLGQYVARVLSTDPAARAWIAGERERAAGRTLAKPPRKFAK